MNHKLELTTIELLVILRCLNHRLENPYEVNLTDAVIIDRIYKKIGNVVNNDLPKQEEGKK